MTIIVWTPTAMAADRLAVRGDTKMYLRKMHRIGNKVIASCGTSDYSEAMFAWYRAGALPEQFPKTQEKDDYSILVVGNAEGVVHYDRAPYPVKLLQPFAAFGCGREAALGALEMGATAHQAVVVACKWISGCGGQIDVEALQ